MRYLDFRFSWIPVLAFIFACVGYLFCLLNLLTNEGYIILFGICGAMFVLGNLLIVFFPKEEDKDYFRLSHKVGVLGVAIVLFSRLLLVFGVLPGFSDFLYYIGLIFVVFAIFSTRK